MNEYRFHATELIAEAFEEHDVIFDVGSHRNQEYIQAAFSIDCGPSAFVRYISTDNDNDVAVRIFSLISKVPEGKKVRVMTACNILNRKIRYTKFYLDRDGDINVEYDFPVQSPDEGLGEMAYEIFVRFMRILDSEYAIFMKALYTEDELDIQENAASGAFPKVTPQLREFLRRLSEARRPGAKSAAGGEEADDSALELLPPEPEDHYADLPVDDVF